MSKFRVDLMVSVEMDIKQEVLDLRLDPEWQKDFYSNLSEEHVAEILARTIIRDGVGVSQIDGFASFKNDAAFLTFLSLTVHEVKKQ